MIAIYNKNNNKNKAISLIKNSLKEYPESINLICISLEYFLGLKEIEEALKVLEMAEQLFKTDPRLYLFKFLISEMLGKPEPSYLEKGIQMDRKYFKIYIYYGNVCQTGEKSEEAYRNALENARSFDEIYTAYQLLIVIEKQNELFKEYPELFKE